MSSTDFRYDVSDLAGKVNTSGKAYAVFLLTISAMFVACFLIKCPQTISAEFTLTGIRPPVNIYSSKDGLMDTVIVEDGDWVDSGDIIAVIESSLNWQSALRLDSCLKNGTAELSALPGAEFGKDELGFVYPLWNDYREAIDKYRNYVRDFRYQDREDALHRKRVQLIENRSHMERQLEIMGERLNYEHNAVVREKTLFEKGMISVSEHESTLKSEASVREEIAAFEVAISNAEAELVSLQQQLLELDSDYRLQISTLRSGYRSAYALLTGKLNDWFSDYVIKAPCDGHVSLQNIWSTHQAIRSGDLVASVIADSDSPVIGRVKISSSGFGKVAVGQTVIVRLNGYPYTEFGTLKGRVSTISAVPEMSEKGPVYTLDVKLPQDLVGAYGKQLPRLQEMNGEALIVTKDRTLIESLMAPIVSLIRNR